MSKFTYGYSPIRGAGSPLLGSPTGSTKEPPSSRAGSPIIGTHNHHHHHHSQASTQNGGGGGFLRSLWNDMRTPQPPRKTSKRLVLILFALVLVLIADGFWLRYLWQTGWEPVTIDPATGTAIAPAPPLHKHKESKKDCLKRAEHDMLQILLLAKKAQEAETDIEDIVAFSDRFLVLNEIESMRVALPTEYPKLNSTMLSLYDRSLAYHHDQLFATLFPYISPSQEYQRSFGALKARYTQGRGIVIPCGADQFQYAVHLISTLKHVLHTKLPITVIYAGGGDLPGDRRSALKSIAPDIETLDIMDYFDEEYVALDGGGWAIKVFAILASPYSETISMDADAIFLQDPERLFDNPGYRETGTLFFRDREIFPGKDENVHKWFRKLMRGRKASDIMMKSPWWTEAASREEMESGVIVFDKRRDSVVMGLVLTGHFNTKDVREPVTYKNTYGDKESFWIAFEFGQLPYYFEPPYASIIGQLTHEHRSAHHTELRICSDHLFHLDHKGQPLWHNGSLFQQKRVKDRGFLYPTHWAKGTVEWDCDPEPWCMILSRPEEAIEITKEQSELYVRLIGTALVWEQKFPGLIEQHY